MITYATAKQLKELGLKQNRHDHARYYVNESMIAYFEDIKNAFRANDWFENRAENTADWMGNFCYIPELLDIIGIPSYELTLEAAIYHFIDGKLSHQKETVDRTEDAIKENNPVVDQKESVDLPDGVEQLKKAIHDTQIA